MYTPIRVGIRIDSVKVQSSETEYSSIRFRWSFSTGNFGYWAYNEGLTDFITMFFFFFFFFVVVEFLYMQSLRGQIIRSGWYSIWIVFLKFRLFLSYDPKSKTFKSSKNYLKCWHIVRKSKIHLWFKLWNCRSS